ncbi:FtsK/SpoIIIE domain-containing protein [Microbacterium sp.]|uniref:FtsK/SpoIIIE domain-containing protein n=1 Tax=Microbacterium sp. TaxID=51671 RepID=UPI003F9D678D
MQQSANKQEESSKLTASDMLRWVLAIAIIVALLAGAAAWQWGWEPGRNIAIASGSLAVLLLVLTVFSRRREALRARMGAYLQTELGSDWNPATGLKASHIKDGSPRRVEITYQDRQPDHDPEWRRKIEDLVRARMGADEIVAKWNIKHNRLVAKEKQLSALDRSRRSVEERIWAVLKPLFRNVDLTVKVADWKTEAETTPTRIDLSYGVTTLDGSEMWAKRVEAMAGLKLGGRWRSKFDPTHDRGFLEERPTLSSNVSHFGVRLYSDNEYRRSLGLRPLDPAAPILYYGIDENGKPQGWQLGKKSTMPHGLFIGPTGGGKTTVLRSLIVGAVAQKIQVYCADPKMIELTPFYQFPGCYIASDPAQIATMIDLMDALMYERYDKIKRNPGQAAFMQPVLFILDELLIARQVLKRYHARTGGKGTPPWFEEISGLLALARSAQIHVAIGVQRPDASLFDDGSRDNLRQRVSLMRLSSQGSQMLWGNPYVGIDLPMVQGRAMASPDGENPIEMQTFWVADPITAQGADREVIEGFRLLGETLFRDVEPLVDVAPFIEEPEDFDPSELPQAATDVELGAAEDIAEVRSALLDFDTQDVSADTLTEGDEIMRDDADAEPVTVVAVEEDDFDEDSVTLTVRTHSGAEELMSVPRDTLLSRVISLAEAA